MKDQIFVGLNVFHRNVDDQAAQEFLALLTGLRQDAHEGVAIRSGDALCGADRVSFEQQAKSEDDPIQREIAPSQGRFVILSERLFADRATESTKAISVFSEALTIHIALPASHCFYVFYFALHAFNYTTYASC